MVSESVLCTVQRPLDRQIVSGSALYTIQRLPGRQIVVSGLALCTVQRPPGRQIVSWSHCSKIFSQADSKYAIPLNCPVTARQAYDK